MYESSLKQKWDYQNGIDYAVKTAVKEVRKKIAKNLKGDEYSSKIIAEYTSLSIAEMEAL
jgi:hypothetical protein